MKDDTEHPTPDSTWTSSDIRFHLAKMHGDPTVDVDEADLTVRHARLHIDPPRPVRSTTSPRDSSYWRGGDPGLFGRQY